MRSCTLLLVLCVWTLGGRQLTAQFPPSETPPAFSVGDAIRITVWGQEQLSGEFAVGENGTIVHPLYQSISVVGVPLDEVRAEVRAVLTRFITEPEFIIEPLIRVGVTGAVNTPNIYSFPSYATVAEAVARAGPGPHAEMGSVRVLRNGATLYVDLTRPYRETAHIRLQTGDQIIVDPDRGIWRRYIQPAISTAGSVASFTWLILRITRVL